MKSVMNAAVEQQTLWDQVFTESEAYFGEGPSLFAEKALALFREKGVRSVLEPGCGQGRDTFLFAEDGIRVTALDYSRAAVDDIKDRACSCELTPYIDPRCFDVRRCMPFEDSSFDACYSHMLLCMELTFCEISCLISEMHRVLKPGGLAVYSVRSIFDRHYRAGEHLGEDLFQIGQFAVHFFSEEKIRGLASGFRIHSIERMEEGALPRDLYCIVMEKTSNRFGPTFASIGARHTPLGKNRASAPSACPGAT
ncbi:class I SAM-dependent methyltransferase [Maridesulfovibrio sp. FT414]|uniref:class I SAM-dependent methyltransferase n=1 Tax=Maridesulfovibrio sp. FT414 TaxID=2979469 RepID=UPI003D805644